MLTQFAFVQRQLNVRLCNKIEFCSCLAFCWLLWKWTSAIVWDDLKKFYEKVIKTWNYWNHNWVVKDSHLHIERVRGRTSHCVRLRTSFCRSGGECKWCHLFWRKVPWKLKNKLNDWSTRSVFDYSTRFSIKKHF